jgi:hypothetical protein
MAKTDPLDVVLRAGATDFVFEGELVHVYGRDGTEASFPVADLEAFIEHLGKRLQDLKEGDRDAPATD